MTESPKTFISYSWTTPEHQAWVLKLATQLVENGVAVILDKWHLREGDDSNVFMEKMVTDPHVKKVIIICDKAYADKADTRKGGVGTETQIISPEVYGKVENNTKFVALIKEKDESGNAYSPTYLKGRIFIDMSDEEIEIANFEQLLRWIFDRPIYQKPELGKPPSYIFEESPISLGTNSKHRVVLDALKQNKISVVGAVRDYFETFAENFGKIRIHPIEGENFEEAILESIESFMPHREEVIEVILSIAKFSLNSEVYRELHKLFELILPFCATKPMDQNRWTEGETDNFRFIVQELFLYAIAILIKYEKFDEANDLLSQTYYSQQLARVEGLQTNSFDYSKFNTYFLFHSLKYRNERENLQSDLIKQRATRREVTFEDIMQSDFLLYLYSVLHLEGLFAEFSWYPFTNSSAIYRSQPFEVFSRGKSIKYFGRVKNLLSIDSKQELIDLIDKSKTESGYVPGFGSRLGKISLEKLMNIDKLASTV